MSIRKIIDWAIQDAKTTHSGTIASDFFQYEDASGNWVWACDVDLGGDENNVLRSVPVAANNKDIIYAEQGKGVNLSRMGNGMWAITGLSKTVNSTVHWTFVSFEDDIFTITGTRMAGNIVRPLTYGELGSLAAPYGYGVLPYGTKGKFDYEGNLIGIVES
jgi:hypothetical protein